MRALLLILLLLLSFNIVLIPIGAVQTMQPAETSLIDAKPNPCFALINSTVKPNEPGSGGGGQGTI